MPTLERLPLLVLGGLGIASAFLDARLWPLAWVAFAPLFAAAPRAATPRSAALDGWLMGLATNVPAFYWLIETMHRFGGFPLPIAASFYGVLSAYGALQFGLVAALLRVAGPGAPSLLAPALWTASEFLFPNLFPWRIAHSQHLLSPLIQIGDVTGPYGLSFVMAWTASALVRRPFAVGHLLPPALAVLLLLGYGGWRGGEVRRALETTPTYRVGLVQGNLALDEKRHADHFDSNVARYQRLSAGLDPTPDLLVWPETVVEWGIPQDSDLPAELDPLPHSKVPLLFGAVSYRGRGAARQWFNSAFLRAPDGRMVGRYDKIVLMPFGEFLPLASLFPDLKRLSPNTGDFTAGAGPGVLAASPEARIGALICYEDLLAGHVRDTVRAGATILAAVTNDAWFGNTAALRQHEMLALWRAIENRRYLVRATNTGLSGVIDPLGTVRATLPIEVASATIAEAQLSHIDSPYQRVGDLFAWSAVALACALLIKSLRSARLVRADGSGTRTTRRG